MFKLISFIIGGLDDGVAEECARHILYREDYAAGHAVGEIHDKQWLTLDQIAAKVRKGISRQLTCG